MKLFPSIRRKLKADLIIVDSIFPQKTPFAFRNSEINEYIRGLNNFYAISMSPIESDKSLNYAYRLGKTKEEYKADLEGYAHYFPSYKNHIRYQDEFSQYNVKLAYSFFIAETYLLLPFYEKQKIPFVFVLYPGGLFGLNSERSDRMLRRIFSSPQFCGVITTQEITMTYLISKRLCDKEKIHHIYGGFVQFSKAQVLPRQYYEYDKKSLDICFVAAKYSEKGRDKGYDLFIRSAHQLVEKHPGANIQFHVIGGFDEREIAIDNIKEKIKFYGYQTPDKLLKIYRSMDILLSPNRPGILYEGNFDGFPLGIDAGYCGVALFVADELSMNRTYKNGKEIVIIKPEAENITEAVERFMKSPAKLRELSIACQSRTQQLFDIDKQIEARINVFQQYTEITYKKGTS